MAFTAPSPGSLGGVVLWVMGPGEFPRPTGQHTGIRGPKKTGTFIPRRRGIGAQAAHTECGRGPEKNPPLRAMKLL